MTAIGVASTTWRQFSFFDSHERRPAELPDDAVCSTSGQDRIYIGCSNGRVAVVDGAQQLADSFQAHPQRIEFIIHSQVFTLRPPPPFPGCPPCLPLASRAEGQAPRCKRLSGCSSGGKTQKPSMLFTMAGRDGHDPWRLRCWAVSGAQPGAVGPSDGIPLSTAKVQLPADVVTVAVHATAWPVLVVAAGLANGKVYILRGDAGLLRLTGGNASFFSASIGDHQNSVYGKLAV